MDWRLVLILWMNARLCVIAQASQWWPLLNQLGASAANGGHRSVDMICNSIPGLVNRQRKMCKNYPRVMIALGEGAKMGLVECRHQFRFDRWNCSHAKKTADFEALNSILQRSTKETAFLYAVSSAGVVYTITRACTEGSLDTCHCDPTRQGQSRDQHGIFQWGGCSDNIRYALKFARSFMDAKDKEMKLSRRPDPRALMNLHNSRAGRRVVWRTKRLLCKCHGVSGACSLRTCWQTLHIFRKVGKIIKRKYERAERIALAQSKHGLMLADGRRRPPPKSALVFYEESPNYCILDVRLGSRGTAGRACNATSTKENSCKKLCCGRGYDTFETIITKECQCKFYWCCSVKCKLCRDKVLVHRCKTLVADIKKS